MSQQKETTIHVSPGATPHGAEDGQLQFASSAYEYHTGPPPATYPIIATGIPVPPLQESHFHQQPQQHATPISIESLQQMAPSASFIIQQANGFVDTHGRPMFVISHYRPPYTVAVIFFIFLAVAFTAGGVVAVVLGQAWKLALAPIVAGLLLFFALCHAGLMGVKITIRPEGYVPPDADPITKQVIDQQYGGAGIPNGPKRYVVDVTYHRLIGCIGTTCCRGSNYRHVNIPIAEIDRMVLEHPPGKPMQCTMFFDRKMGRRIIVGGNPNRGCCVCNNEQAQRECNFWARVMRNLRGTQAPHFTIEQVCCPTWYIGC